MSAKESNGVRRVLIVDGDPRSRAVLRELLDEHADVEVVDEAHSVAEAVAQIIALHPDAVFLDIEMPDGLGFELFELLDETPPVIFVTASDHYAVRAFEVNALDYLVKPVQRSAVDRALARVHLPDEVLATGAPANEPSDRLSPSDVVCLHETSSMKFTKVSDILFIEAAEDYTQVHLATGKVALVTQRLRRWEERLPPNFVRTHRSVLVNLERVDEIGHVQGRWLVHLRGRAEPLAMSRRFAQALRKRLELVV